MIRLSPRALALATLLLSPIAARAEEPAELTIGVDATWKIHNELPGYPEEVPVAYAEYPLQAYDTCRFAAPEEDGAFQNIWRLEDPDGLALCSLVVERADGKDAPVTLTVVPDAGSEERVREAVTQVTPQQVVVHGYTFPLTGSMPAPKLGSRRLPVPRVAPEPDSLPLADADSTL